jgi:hypothetical protein
MNRGGAGRAWREPLHRANTDSDVDFESADEMGSVEDYDPEGVPPRPPAGEGDASQMEVDFERQLQEVQVRRGRGDRWEEGGTNGWRRTEVPLRMSLTAASALFAELLRTQNPQPSR